MTIVMKQVGVPAKPTLSLDDFKRWLKQFDHDGDNRINRNELRTAMRTASVRFTWFKSGEGMREADTNKDGVLDDAELENLVTFAERKLGMKITSY
ncbi:unnamed protein product [Victoria cruziana]